MVRQDCPIQHRRKADNACLRFEQLLPGNFLNVCNIVFANAEFGQQLFGGFGSRLTRGEPQR